MIPSRCGVSAVLNDEDIPKFKTIHCHQTHLSNFKQCSRAECLFESKHHLHPITVQPGLYGTIDIEPDLTLPLLFGTHPPPSGYYQIQFHYNINVISRNMPTATLTAFMTMIETNRRNDSTSEPSPSRKETRISPDLLQPLLPSLAQHREHSQQTTQHHPVASFTTLHSSMLRTQKIQKWTMLCLLY